MDDTGGLRRRVADVNRPGARLLGANREVGLQAQQLIGFADQAVQARFFETERFQEFLAFAFVEHGDFRLDLRRDDDAVGVVDLGAGGDLVRQVVAGRSRGFFDVTDVQCRL